jgi:hypothetical protein
LVIGFASSQCKYLRRVDSDPDGSVPRLKQRIEKAGKLHGRS